MFSVVLARRDLREHDQVITLYTLENGKVEVLARGIKKILSKNSAFLEPGSLVNAEIIPGKEFSHLGSVELVDIATSVRKNISSLSLLLWSVELIKNLVREGEADVRLFKLIVEWIKFLDSKEGNISRNVVFIADIFVCKIFSFLGFDITKDEVIEPAIRNDLQIILKADWSKIIKLELDKKNFQTLHNIIFKFAEFHGEKKLINWAKLAYFSPK